MEPDPPRETLTPSHPGSRLSWPMAAAVIGLLAVLAWALVGGVIWSVMR